MSKASAIDIAGVSKVYGETVAVDSISLKIPGGSYCCLLGPSGCGKTSTLRMIAGHETISAGDILLGNTMLAGLPPARRGTAMMFQSYALFPHLDLLDNVAFSLKMKGMPRDERRAKAQAMLELMGMAAYAARRPAQLSGGQQQRVALARALITDPRRSCSTSRSPHSTPSSRSGCAPSSRSCRRRSASPSSTSPTARRRRWRSPT
ncbi:MAG: ABC transporter ATP-binding protein [Geminicoccaceae bacterium]